MRFCCLAVAVRAPENRPNFIRRRRWRHVRAAVFVREKCGNGYAQVIRQPDHVEDFAKLFTLSVLLSSYFIFNSIGCIDEQSIQ